MRKFLFLDIDGVLNSEKWARSPNVTFIHGHCYGINPAAVKLLNQVVKKLIAKLLLVQHGEKCIL